jgi:hypothetical protein
MPTNAQIITAYRRLERAQRELYRIAGGSFNSGNVSAAHISTSRRTEYFDSAPFRNWVKSENACGRQVFWLKDVDKTQADGDIFTFMFKFRADRSSFTPRQLGRMNTVLRRRKLNTTLASDHSRLPYDVLHHWQAAEQGGEGLPMLKFWADVYWPTQIGLTRDQKRAMVNEFAPTYVDRIYPGVPEENRTLADAGVHVVIVSNGDQELAGAVAPYLGIPQTNVVGSHLTYDENGISTGVNHSYEVFDEDWTQRPQPGKPLSFHYWLRANMKRWGWKSLDERRVVVGGRDGDSASADGGMMILMPPHSAIGNFMVDTPGEPGRIRRFYPLAAKYGWTPGRFIRLDQLRSKLGAKP